MQSKTPLWAEVLSSLFLLVISFCNFMGLYYITEGNFLVSILVSLLVTAIYYFIVQNLKKNKQYLSQRNYADIRSVSLVFYLALALGAFVMAFHFLNVEKNGKPHIQQQAAASINGVIAEAVKFDTLASNSLIEYEGQLKSKLAAYKNTGNNTLRNELALKPYNMADQVLATPSYIDVSTVADANIQPYRQNVEKSRTDIKKKILDPAVGYQNAFNDWNMLGIMSAYNNLNKFLKDSYNLLNNQRKDLPVAVPAVVHKASLTSLPLSNPFAFAEIFPADYLLPGLLIVFIHLFILLPFFAQPVKAKGGEKTKTITY